MALAKEYFSRDTLETRNSDSLDFKEAAVWDIRYALILAYRAGVEAATKKAGTR